MAETLLLLEAAHKAATSALHSRIPSEEEEYERGSSSLCNSPDASFLERMSHVLEDPLPPAPPSVANTPRQRKLPRMSTTSSSIRFAADYPMPISSERSSFGRRKYPSEQSSLRSSQISSHILSPMRSAPVRDTTAGTRASAVSASPPRPARKSSTASDVSPSVVEALVGAYGNESPMLLEQRPSTFCISTPRLPKIGMSSQKDDSSSSVASTVAVVTPIMEYATKDSVETASLKQNIFRNFPRFVSRSVGSTILETKGPSRLVLFINIFMLCFSLYSFIKLRSEVAAVNNILARLEERLLITGYPHPSALGLDSFSGLPQDPFGVNQSPPLSGTEKQTKGPLPKATSSWPFGRLKSVWQWSVPLRIKPRQKGIYMSTLHQNHRLSSILQTASTFFWFLCKTVMVPLWWCAAMLIRTAVFAVIVPAILFAMFGVNVLKLMIRLNWIRLLSGEFLEDLLHQADLPPRHAKEPTNKT